MLSSNWHRFAFLSTWSNPTNDLQVLNKSLSLSLSACYSAELVKTLAYARARVRMAPSDIWRQQTAGSLCEGRRSVVFMHKHSAAAPKKCEAASAARVNLPACSCHRGFSWRRLVGEVASLSPALCPPPVRPCLFGAKSKEFLRRSFCSNDAVNRSC